ncbi:hypothetical protein QJS04_geneDACA024718 [Acorus gramineus]|uniref:DUF4283 domain-containing protein n=1 Tax=Acorus gramineus TaxID=55184 RepID=A0AAV8ZYX1_ACOGR|nr:hypothetical protein QJS04_geneDACA024718 [Acorus gramineus]
MVRFDLEEDLIHVLEGGPWSMVNRPFVIQRWNRDIRLELERLKSIPVWIKFPNLPLHFWSRTCIAKIASLIGTPLYLDSPTASRSRSAYARVCVEVEPDSTLPDEVFVEVRNGDREAIRVTYDWKPEACAHCKTFSHDDAICSKKPRFINAPSNTNVVSTAPSKPNVVAAIAPSKPNDAAAIAPSKPNDTAASGATEGVKIMKVAAALPFIPTAAIASGATAPQTKEVRNLKAPLASSDVTQKVVSSGEEPQNAYAIGAVSKNEESSGDAKVASVDPSLPSSLEAVMVHLPEECCPKLRSITAKSVEEFFPP